MYHLLSMGSNNGNKIRLCKFLLAHLNLLFSDKNAGFFSIDEGYCHFLQPKMLLRVSFLCGFFEKFSVIITHLQFVCLLLQTWYINELLCFRITSNKQVFIQFINFYNASMIISKNYVFFMAPWNCILDLVFLNFLDE